MKKIKFYRLGCNRELEAAKIAFEGMENWYMKLKAGFITHESMGEHIMVAAGRIDD